MGSSIVAGGDFPGGPVVNAPCFHCREHGSITGWRINIPYAE